MMVAPGSSRYSSAGSTAGFGSGSGAPPPKLLRKASASSLRVGADPSISTSTTTPTPSRRTSMQRIATSSPSSSRRTSTNTMMPSPLRHASSPERPVPTAMSVASEYFAAELDALHGLRGARESSASSGDAHNQLETETVVILNDACYGHRFSRPRTNRAALATIVERPERIQAGVLGVALAYVRLGERHAQGRLPPRPIDVSNHDPAGLPRSMPFRIRKTTNKVPLMSPAVTNVHGAKWMEELKIMCDSAEMKLAMGEKELKRPDMNRGPDQRGEPPGFHDGDLYLCAESLDALEGSLGAVCEAVDAVFTTTSRRAFVAVRPPGHHCSASYPSGFCWVNNVHVGIMHGALNHGLTHAAIIDFDLHHGDGSQTIAWAYNSKGHRLPRNTAAWRRTSVGYFSIHDINSYPCEDGDEDKVRNASLCIENAHGQTVWNVHLQPWKTEADFWALYEKTYSAILEKTRTYLRVQADRLRALNQAPKAAIFFSAGFDASEWESAGMQRHNVNVPTEFYARITQDVVRIAAEEGLGVDGRIVSVLEGGYSDRALISGVCSHLCGLATTDHETPGAGGSVTPTTPRPSTGRSVSSSLATEMSERMGLLSVREDSPDAPSASPAPAQTYDPAWWTSVELDRLDTPADAPSPAQSRHVTPASYSSPTTASTAKAVDPAHYRRSLSGIGAPRPYSPAPVAAPEVPWFVAARELSKLLIPTNRSVGSCKAEELNAEASRVRRDRQVEMMQSTTSLGVLPDTSDTASAIPAAPPTATHTVRASTRERKTVKPYGSEEPAPKAATRRGRRPSPTTATPPAASTTVTAPAAPRSESAASIRPQSSVSVRPPPPANLAVKKTRPSATTATVARAPRGTKKASTSPSRTAPSHPSGSAAPAADPVDQLSTGMKQIKITWITKEQREARERERAEAERAEQARIERESETAPEPVLLPADAVTRAEPAPDDAPLSPPLAPSVITSSSVADTHTDVATSPIPPSASSFATAFTIPDLPPASQKTSTALPSTPKSNYTRPPPVSSPLGSEGFSPAGRIRPGSISSSTSIPHQKWIPQAQQQQRTDRSSPSSPARHPNLPVFTPTSAIPFASPPHGSASARSSPGRDGGAGGLVRTQAARIAALEAAAAGQAVWGPDASPPPRDGA